MDTKEIMDTTEKYYLPVFGRSPIALDHGEGVYLYDTDGNRYTDFLAGIAVNALGYAYPPLVKAVSDQAARIMHGSNLFYYEIQANTATARTPKSSRSSPPGIPSMGAPWKP